MIPLTKDQMIKRNQKSKMHHQKKFFKLALRKYSQNEHLESTPPVVSGKRNQYSSLMSDLLTDFLRS